MIDDAANKMLATAAAAIMIMAATNAKAIRPGESLSAETLAYACNPPPTVKEAERKGLEEFCHTYLTGYHDGLTARVREPWGRFLVCMPAGTTFRNEAQVYFKFLAGHPETRKLPARQAVVQAFASEWPCPEETADQRDGDVLIGLVQRWDYLNLDCRGGDASDEARLNKACDERLSVENKLKRLGCTIDHGAWSCGKSGQHDGQTGDGRHVGERTPLELQEMAVRDEVPREDRIYDGNSETSVFSPPIQSYDEVRGTCSPDPQPGDRDPIVRTEITFKSRRGVQTPSFTVAHRTRGGNIYLRDQQYDLAKIVFDPDGKGVAWVGARKSQPETIMTGHLRWSRFEGLGEGNEWRAIEAFKYSETVRNRRRAHWREPVMSCIITSPNG